jgi:hypothetical protein
MIVYFLNSALMYTVHISLLFEYHDYATKNNKSTL